MHNDPTHGLAPAVATVDLAALRHNLGVLRRRLGPLTLVAVVKANAYGHGAVPIARHLEEMGIGHLAVATLPEAIQLRGAGIACRILVFAAPLPDHLIHYVRHDLDVTVPSVSVAGAVARAARSHGRLRAHLKVDTGMGRIGVPVQEAVEAVRLLEAAPEVDFAALWTHFSTADEREHALVGEQLRRFDALMDLLGTPPAPVHVANSGALLTQGVAIDPGSVHGARLGITLYGMYDPPEDAEPDRLKPILTLSAPITQVKTVEAGTPISYGATWHAPRRTRIGTVAIGYADGYRRMLSNRAQIGVGGRLVPIAGRVCMDMIMVDLGPEGEGPPAEVGTSAVLVGPGGPSVFQVARWCDTITYEVTCGLTGRVARRYVGG